MNKQNEHFIEASISTTSGFHPDEGFVQVPINQKISVLIKKATKELNIADTTGWIAVYDGKELNLEASYADNNLSGEVQIDWGKSEGGGGCA